MKATLLLPYLFMFAAGVLCGTAHVRYLDDETVQELDRKPEPESLRKDIGQLRQAIDELQTTCTELRDSMRRSNTELADLRRAKLVVSDQEETGDDPPVDENLVSARSWESVLDQSVASRLVEHGLTPFDPAVTPSVRACCATLREASNNLHSRLDSLDSEYKQGTITRKQKSERRDAAYADYQRSRKEALEAFVAALARLLDG